MARKISGCSQMDDLGTAAAGEHYSTLRTPSPSNVSSSHSDEGSNPRPKRCRKSSKKLPGKTATNKERHFVQHNYQDLLNESGSSNGDDYDLSRRLSADSFPMILHRMLDEVEAEGYAHIISWQPHGRAFLIRDPSLFKQVIMPKYFPRSGKFTSVQRQFNIYGFEKLTRDGPDKGAYYHEAFLRGKPELTSRRMSRKRIKGTGHKACSNPDAEPDFYIDMPFVVDNRSRSSLKGTQRQVSTAPTMEEVHSSLIASVNPDHFYLQERLNQQQQLLSSSRQMWQGYDLPGTLPGQFNEHARSATQGAVNERIDGLFCFDWDDAAIFAASMNDQGRRV